MMDVDVESGPVPVVYGPTRQASRLNGGAVAFVPQQGLAKPFRFMDFPWEIRNQVYEDLLCPYPDHDVDDRGRYHWSDIGPLFDTAILYTNRQVYTEAREAMLRGNQFIRIFTRGVVVTAILGKAPVHVVAHSHHSRQYPVVRDFKGAVMSYFLSDPEDIRENGHAHFNTCDALILGRDLEALVRCVGMDPPGVLRMASRVKHHINIHDPFWKGKDPHYSSLALQKRFLQPFRDHFRGFAHVKINGKVDKDLAATVLREVRHESMPDPEEFLTTIEELKSEGNVYFRERSFTSAIEKWRHAAAKMMHLRTSRLWPRVATQLGTEFVDRLAELSFNVNSNQAQAVLAEMHEHDADNIDEMEYGLDHVEMYLNMATTAGTLFASAWEPSPRQQAKVFFRSAQAARMAMQLHLAQESIEHALDLQPDDELLQREHHEIGRSMFVTMAEMGFIDAPGL